MSDLISRQDAIEALTKANLKKHMDSVQDGGQENRSAIRIIMEMPTADVVEQKRGEWIAVNIDVQSWTVQCSNCHCIGLYGQTAYCPNCGAEMRKGGK